MTKQGLVVHCHHDLLIEWCHSFQERVDYIKSDKPKSEQKTRLKLFKMLSTEAIADLPKYLVEASRKLDEAYRKWDEAYHKWDEAYRKRGEAYRKLAEADCKRDEAYRKWAEVDRKVDEADRKWDEAYRKRFEADRKWAEAYNRWINTKGARNWHDKHCGCKEWSWEKKEIIFK